MKNKVLGSANEALDEVPVTAEPKNPLVPLTEFQERCIAALKKSSNSVSTNDLAARLRTSRVAVVSAMRALERKGLAGSHRWPPHDQWAALYWFLRNR